MKAGMTRWAGHVKRKGNMGNAYKILVEKHEEKRPLGGLRRRWEDNIKTNHGEIRWV
jgi:hypothetical protein